MIEADVTLAETTRYPIPIMAHPPMNMSDITLDDWLLEVVRSETLKGIKLDFKSTRVVEPAFRVLARHSDFLRGPLILNADVLQGLTQVSISCFFLSLLSFILSLSSSSCDCYTSSELHSIACVLTFSILSFFFHSSHFLSSFFHSLLPSFLNSIFSVTFIMLEQSLLSTYYESVIRSCDIVNEGSLRKEKRDH